MSTFIFVMLLGVVIWALIKFVNVEKNGASRPVHTVDIKDSLSKIDAVSNGSVERVLKPYINRYGEYQVTCDQLAKSVNSSAYKFASQYAPNQHFLNDLAVGSVVGGSLGSLKNMGAVAGLLSSSYKKGAITGGFVSAAFTSPKSEDDGTMSALAELRIANKLNQSEFVRAMAAVLYNQGNGKCNFVTYDTFSSPVFKNDTEKLIAMMAYEYFNMHAVDLTKVKQLLMNNMKE
jgi:hypothetical protein